MGLHGVKAVFFDLDNTLIDTAAAGRCAIEEVLPLSPFRPGGRGAARVPLPSRSLPCSPAARGRAGSAPAAPQRPDARPRVPCR